MSKRVNLKMNFDRATINAIVKNGGKKAVWSALDHLATVSKQQVPLDTGVLMNSCAVSVSDDGSQGTVSYDTPYAVVQHERQNYNHQRGRKAKYLEGPCYDKSVQSDMLRVAQQAYASEME